MDKLVSTKWLAAELGADDLRVIDATAFLPEHARDAAREHAACHIPGAVFADLENLVDHTSPIGNTLPGGEQFASQMQSLGVGDDCRIVVYDDSPLHSSARLWFMLQHFGARHVALLDGGIAKWKAEGRACAQGHETPHSRPFTVSDGDGALRTKAQVLANITSHAEQLVDARGAGRFTGAVPETRPGLASGHIPGARNLAYASLFAPDGTWLPPAALAAAFAASGVDLAQPMIATCGSGMTANVVLFAAHLLGKHDLALYDGSWSEWGADRALPVETGPAN